MDVKKSKTFCNMNYLSAHSQHQLSSCLFHSPILGWASSETCPGHHSEGVLSEQMSSSTNKLSALQGPSTEISVSWLICVSDSQALSA